MSVVRTKAWRPEERLRLLALPPVIFLVPTFIMPLILVVYRGFDGSPQFGGIFLQVLSDPVYLNVLYQTFRIALVSTLLAFLIGFPVAYFIAHTTAFWANLSFALVMIPFWTSVVTRTYAWIVLLGRRGVVNSALTELGWVEQPLRLMYNDFGVQVGMVQILLPMMILPILSAMRQLDTTKLLAATVLGANPIRVFVHVYLPMCLSGIVAGCLLVFVTALGFYVTPAVLGSDRDMMISVMIEQQVTQTLNWPLASALAAILLVIAVLSIWLILYISARCGIRLGAL